MDEMDACDKYHPIQRGRIARQRALGTSHGSAAINPGPLGRDSLVSLVHLHLRLLVSGGECHRFWGNPQKLNMVQLVRQILSCQDGVVSCF